MAFLGSDWNDDFDDNSPIGISSSMKEDIREMDYCYTEKKTVSNEKFTQGEWFAVISEPLEDDFCCDVYDKNKLCICSCFNSHEYNFETKEWEGITEAQKEANMHLIAAAPEMYAKLKTVLALCEGGLLRKTRCDILGAEIDDLLKKARGEE